MDRRPSFDSAVRAFGFDVLVRLPGGDQVDTVGIWLPAATVEVPIGETFARAEPRRILALPLADLLEVPRGAVIVAPEARGLEVLEWRVEESDKVDYDHHRAVVVRSPE